MTKAEFLQKANIGEVDIFLMKKINALADGESVDALIRRMSPPARKRCGLVETSEEERGYIAYRDITAEINGVYKLLDSLTESGNFATLLVNEDSSADVDKLRVKISALKEEREQYIDAASEWCRITNCTMPV